MLNYSKEQLLEELAESNDFFDMLVDMIPSKLYIAGQSGDDYTPNPRYMKSATEGSKEARKAAAKASKRRKLDPTQYESTVEKKKRLDPSQGTPIPKPTGENSSDAPELVVKSPNQSRIESLREKLHAKILAKQGNRPNPDQVSKRAARRAEKKRRLEDRQKAAAKSKTASATSTNYKVASKSTNDPSQDLATLDFGRLAGLNPGKQNYFEANKALANMSKTKNLEKILADAEAKRQKLEQLKKSDDAEDKEKAKSMQWSDALKEADGQRVKDDPAKIKKALKRKAAKKTKSQKAWKVRLEKVSTSQGDRQKVREHNLKLRKQGGSAGANLSRKEIRDPAKQDEDQGRRLSRAGFEGRKQEFLNSPKTRNNQ